MHYAIRFTCVAWIGLLFAARLNAVESATDAWPTIAQCNHDDSSPSCVAACSTPYQVWNQGTPHLQFTLDLLVLDRSDADASPLLFDSQTQEVLLDTGDLIKEGEPGVRMGLILFDDCGYDLEISYLGLDTFGESVTRSSNNPIVFPFFGGVPANPQSSYTTRYASELNSGEINLRQRFGSRVALLAGFRFLELNEHFNIVSDAGGFFSSTDNDLYGLQIGADVQWLRVRRSVLFTTIKAGAYYNNADVSARATSGGGPIQFIDDEDEMAVVGELAAGLLIPMGPQADFRIGYQGLFLDGVGLAPDQSDNYLIFNGSGSLDKATVLYHGGFLGVDLFF